MIRSKIWGLAATIILMMVLLGLRYQPYLAKPNDAYFQLYGDGFKNYATVVYHVKHDSTYLHYGGMNYPYGEHVMFTDGQPILSNTIKWISRNVADISENTVAIINLAPIASFLLCSALLYLIFMALGLPPWYSGFVAIALAMFSPQTYRLNGHYALSYAFVIPMILYALLHFEARPRWGWSIFTGIFLITVALLHFYFFGIGAMLIAFYFLFHLLRRFSWQKLGQLAAHFGVQVLLPFVALQGWLRWSDPVPDRPTIPMGFLNYHAFWEGLLTSRFMPYWHWIDQYWVDIRDLDMESEVYIGLVAVITLVVLAVRWLRRRMRVSFLPFTDSVFLKNLFPAAFIILLLSLGLPFTIPGLDVLVDYVGPYRQFRGQARFAWVFYYSWNIIVWYILFHWAQCIKPLWRKYTLLGGALASLGYESWQFAVKATPTPWYDDQLNRQKFEADDAYWFKNIDLRRYQAVLPIPYFHVGSENFTEEVPGDLLRFSLLPGWHYGLPNLGVWLSRTSFDQTFHSYPMALLPYRPYSFLERLPNQKPLLIVLDKAQFYTSKRNYGYLLRYAKLLYENDKLQLLEVAPEAFNQGVEAWRQDVRNGWTWAQQNCTFQNGFWLCKNVRPVLYMPFDSLRAERVYQGGGALELPVRERVRVFESMLPAAHSFCEVWVYVGQDQYPRVNFMIWEIAPDGRETQIAHNGTRFDLIAVDKNGWGLVQFPILMKDGANRVRFELQCREILHPKVFLDELLIRPMDVDVFRTQGGWLMHNNFWFQ